MLCCKITEVEQTKKKYKRNNGSHKQLIDHLISYI